MKNKNLQAGDRAPDFDLPADSGGRVSLSRLKGKSVVVYFYPKDNTSGCTAEALAFSKDARSFADAGAMVIGISKDNVVSHERFKAKYDLSLTLAADESTKTAEAYGVWVEKSMYGRRYMGMERATFLIDGRGVIRQVWRKVKVPGHSAEVLKAARSLKAGTAAAG